MKKIVKKIYEKRKRVLIIALLIFGLCACGSRGGETSDDSASLAKEHVYRVQEVALPEFGGDEYEICASAYGDRTISLLVKVTDWEDYNDNDLWLLSVKDDGSGLLYSNRTGVCSYVPGEEDGAEKMNFINSDLHVSGFDALISLDEQSFAGVFREGYSGEAALGIFTHLEPEDIPDRSVLVLSGSYISDEVLRHVVEFNRSNSQYRVVVQNVEEYDSEEALAAGVMALNNSILSGDMPDILVTEGLPTELYESKGLLADVGALIEEDEELSGQVFLRNVFDAYSRNGKLYYVIPRFEVHTLIGPSSVFGDRISWTSSDMAQIFQSLPEGATLLSEADRTSFLQAMMTYCGGDLLDMDTGKCSFQSQYFLDMAEYAKSLPASANPDSYGEEYWRNYELQYREGRTLLAGMPVSSFSEVNYYVNGIFGEEASYIGFPGADDSGSYIRATQAYAISSRSEHIEGAWEFLRYYLTDTYQSEAHRGLPVQYRLFEESAKAALLEPTVCHLSGETVTLEPLTDEQLDRLLTFILSVDRRCCYNETVMSIVNEEIEGFFSGGKSLRETAGIIQSRVQLYLDTNTP